MKCIQTCGERRRSLVQQGVVLVAGIVLASTALLASSGRDAASSSAFTNVSGSTASRRGGSRPDARQTDAWAAPSGAAAQARRMPLSPEQQDIDFRVAQQQEIADTLRRRGDHAWQAGDYSAAVACYRQNWTVAPGFPPLTAAREHRWEIADRLQRAGNAAWQAGDVRQAASRYHQSQAGLP